MPLPPSLSLLCSALCSVGSSKQTLLHNVQHAREEKRQRKGQQHLVGALAPAVLLQQLARLRYRAGGGVQFVARAGHVRRGRDQRVQRGGTALRRLRQVPGDGEHALGDAVLLTDQTGATVPRRSGAVLAAAALSQRGGRIVGAGIEAGSGGRIEVGVEELLLFELLDLELGGYVGLAECLQRPGELLPMRVDFFVEHRIGLVAGPLVHALDAFAQGGQLGATGLIEVFQFDEGAAKRQNVLAIHKFDCIFSELKQICSIVFLALPGRLPLRADCCRSAPALLWRAYTFVRPFPVRAVAICADAGA